jgi:hypothetical protein
MILSLAHLGRACRIIPLPIIPLISFPPPFPSSIATLVAAAVLGSFVVKFRPLDLGCFDFVRRRHGIFEPLPISLFLTKRRILKNF